MKTKIGLFIREQGMCFLSLVRRRENPEQSTPWMVYLAAKLINKAGNYAIKQR